jgi:hypothetical protein
VFLIPKGQSETLNRRGTENKEDTKGQSETLNRRGTDNKENTKGAIRILK